MSDSAANLNYTDLFDKLPDDTQRLSCEICLKSIPLTESEMSEVEDYVAYFCGLECYELWRNQKLSE